MKEKVVCFDYDKHFYIAKAEDKVLGKLDASEILLLYLLYNVNMETGTKKYKTVVEDFYELAGNQADEFWNILREVFSFLIKDYILDFANLDIKEMIQSGFGKGTVWISHIRYFVPAKLVISLTDKCFVNCIYCYAKKKGSIAKNEELPLVEIEKLLRKAKEWNIKEIDFTGGDPLAHSCFREIFDMLRFFDIKVNFSTKKNLSERDVSLLVEYEDLIASLQLSIDSIYENEEKILTGVSTFKNKLSIISDLVKKTSLDIKINSVLTKYNIDRIFDLTEVLIGLPRVKHGFSPYTLSLCQMDSKIFPSLAQYSEFKRKLLDYPYQERLIYPVSLVKSNEEIAEMTVCKAGTDGLVVNFDGNVYVCERMCSNSDYAIGSIFVDDLVDIWNGSKIRKFNYPDKDSFLGSECFNCKNFESCIRKRGLCYVHSAILNGKIFSPDNYCSIKRYDKRIN